MQEVQIVGAGLAGCEAAYQLAKHGIKVKLWEMRPAKMTPAHRTELLAELVCSNSLKSDLPDTAQALLKREMRLRDSLLLQVAQSCRVPAGAALAVDTAEFALRVTRVIEENPFIELVREEMTSIPNEGVTIIATGPLTSDALSQSIMTLTGCSNLFFYDAVAPSVTLESLDLTKIFKASRYDKGDSDYYNCPFTKEEYEAFYAALTTADTKTAHDFEAAHYFSGCMPVEEIAARGVDTLRFGPMRPVGLSDPRTGKRAWAVLQLRQENIAGTVLGLVGFQTRLKWPDQAQVFRMIPGLEQAEFVRYGVMHRNTYLNSPMLLAPTLAAKKRENLFFAGQITGVEGYMESAATGILAGINAVCALRGEEGIVLPQETMLGALVRFITEPAAELQPMNANFGILPPLSQPIRAKKERYAAYADRAVKVLQDQVLPLIAQSRSSNTAQ